MLRLSQKCIVGYTSLKGNDEKHALTILRKNKEIHQAAISRFDGKWLKEMGDGILVSFQTISSFLGEHKLKHVDEPVKIYSVNVEQIPEEYTGQITPQAQRHKAPLSKYLVTTLFSLIVLLPAFSFSLKLYFNKRSDDVSEKSIAVLPFVDMSPEGDQEYLCDGLVEELLNILTRVPDLKVISRTSCFQFKDEKIDAREVGELLGVNHMLEGSVRKFGDQVRITAQLINTTDGSHIWSENYDRAFDDLIALQDEIACSISEKLKASIETQIALAYE
jgi:adenylate cyclase